MIPVWAQAGLWGLLAGGALLIGAYLGYYVRIPKVLSASVMSFGSGILISAVSFEFMDEAYKMAGFIPTAAGFLGGGIIFTSLNILISHKGGKHRKRSG